jgi:hypothetical protein
MIYAIGDERLIAAARQRITPVYVSRRDVD